MKIPKNLKQIINHERGERGERKLTEKRGYGGGGGHDGSKRRERGNDREERKRKKKKHKMEEEEGPRTIYQTEL